MEISRTVISKSLFVRESLAATGPKCSSRARILRWRKELRRFLHNQSKLQLTIRSSKLRRSQSPVDVAASPSPHRLRARRERRRRSGSEQLARSRRCSKSAWIRLTLPPDQHCWRKIGSRRFADDRSLHWLPARLHRCAAFLQSCRTPRTMLCEDAILSSRSGRVLKLRRSRWRSLRLPRGGMGFCWFRWRWEVHFHTGRRLSPPGQGPGSRHRPAMQALARARPGLAQGVWP